MVTQTRGVQLVEPDIEWVDWHVVRPHQESHTHTNNKSCLRPYNVRGATGERTVGVFIIK